MKLLSGSDLASYIKARQANEVASLPSAPQLLIIRDSDNPVITKYVNLKVAYGADIGVAVEDYLASTPTDISARIQSASQSSTTSGIIIQLPLTDTSLTDKLCDLIPPAKDVDGLGAHAAYDSATATAILWLLAGYDIKLEHKRIAIVGRGKLVGAPLYRIYTASHYDVTLFHRGDDLTKLKQFDIIISATGVPGLITSDFISPGTTLVDAGTASENGIIKGDLAAELYQRTDLAAITPQLGGVGPLTVACLFDHVIQSTKVSS